MITEVQTLQVATIGTVTQVPTTFPRSDLFGVCVIDTQRKTLVRLDPYIPWAVKP